MAYEDLKSDCEQFVRNFFKIESIKVENEYPRYRVNSNGVFCTIYEWNENAISFWCETGWVGDDSRVNENDVIFSIALERKPNNFRGNSEKSLRELVQERYPSCYFEDCFKINEMKERTLVAQYQEQAGNYPDILFFTYFFKKENGRNYKEDLYAFFKALSDNQLLSKEDISCLQDSSLKQYLKDNSVEKISVESLWNEIKTSMSLKKQNGDTSLSYLNESVKYRHVQYIPQDRIDEDWASSKCHYEFHISNNKLNVSFHCEGGFKKQNRLAELILKEPLFSGKTKEWQKIDGSCIVYALIDVKDSVVSVATKAVDAMCSFEKEFGNKIVELIKRSKEMNKTNDLLIVTKKMLEANHNIILHGAPGTGKTYLAKEIASEMGAEYEMVQFHQSYDYTDFVEGLRPTKKGGKSDVAFEKVDGVFKSFCESALKNLRNVNDDNASKESALLNLLDDYLEECEESEKEFSMKKGSVFKIDHHDDRYIYTENSDIKRDIKILVKDMIRLLDVKSMENVIDIKKQFGRTHRQKDSYMYSLWKDFKNSMPSLSGKKEADKDCSSGKCELRNYVFIIDEINRGEMSKIFGELFYSIDPGYRVSWQDLEDVQSGKSTQSFVRTQYANMESDSNEWDDALHITDVRQYGHFFVPENVYIIGTMNDIDRSVESMDFAMRRRFAFKEVKADDRVEMLYDEKTGLGDLADAAKRCMKALNNAIWNPETKEGIPGLSSAYHIGPAYFLKLKNYAEEENPFEKLWEYHIAGVLKEYLRGMDPDEKHFNALKSAYDAEVVK